MASGLFRKDRSPPTALLSLIEAFAPYVRLLVASFVLFVLFLTSRGVQCRDFFKPGLLA